QGQNVALRIRDVYQLVIPVDANIADLRFRFQRCANDGYRMVQHLALPLSGDPLRSAGGCAILSDGVSDVAIHAKFLALNSCTREKELSLSDLLHAHT